MGKQAAALTEAGKEAAAALSKAKEEAAAELLKAKDEAAAEKAAALEKAKDEAATAQAAALKVPLSSVRWYQNVITVACIVAVLSFIGSFYLWYNGWFADVSCSCDPISASPTSPGRTYHRNRRLGKTTRKVVTCANYHD